MGTYNGQVTERRGLESPKNMRFLEITPRHQKAGRHLPETTDKEDSRLPKDNDITDSHRANYPGNDLCTLEGRSDLATLGTGDKGGFLDGEGLEIAKDRLGERANSKKESRLAYVVATSKGPALATRGLTTDRAFLPKTQAPRQSSTSEPQLTSPGVSQRQSVLPETSSINSSESKLSSVSVQNKSALSLEALDIGISSLIKSQGLHFERPPNPNNSNQRSAPVVPEAEDEVDWVDSEIDSTIPKNVETLPTNRKFGLAKRRAISKTIHILGTGTVGRFIAHSLVRMTESPPVVMLLHRPLLMQQWHQEGAAINFIKDGKIDSRSELRVESAAGFHAKDPNSKVRGFSRDSPRKADAPDNIIETLIVTTDGSRTLSALSAIKHRLRAYSTVCFVQDGLGVVDQINEIVFPRPSSRPSYMLGSISHDLQSIGRSFTVLERRPGTLSLTIVPQTEPTGRTRRMDFGWTPRSRYLMRTLCRAPELQATGYLLHEFYKMQLEKLAINSVIGPLSVAYNCTNDQLLYNYQITLTMKMLLKEISAIVRQLPEISRIRNVDQHFSPERLESLVLSVIGKTGKNRTSMLQAVMGGRKSNIDFYNGYLLNRASELGIDCPCLEMIVAMVKGKQAVVSREKNSYIPFKDEY